VQPRGGAFPEIIEATEGGICYDRNDPETLAKAIEDLLLDPERARRMGRLGRKVVLDEFSIKQTARRMIEVYQKCVKK